MAFNGLIPGKTFWVSAAPRATEERVARLVVTTIDSRPPSLLGSGVGSSASSVELEIAKVIVHRTSWRADANFIEVLAQKARTVRNEDCSFVKSIAKFVPVGGGRVSMGQQKGLQKKLPQARFVD